MHDHSNDKLNPHNLITADGLPQFGIFPEPVQHINYHDFHYFNVMDKAVSNWRRNRQFNQFQFIGLVCDELIMGCAIVDLKLVSNAFVYFYSPKTKKLKEMSFLQPFARKTHIETQPDHGVSKFTKGKNRFEISASTKPRQRALLVELKNGDRVEIILQEPKSFAPLPICSQTGYCGWTYTQKAAGLPVMGEVHWQGSKYDISNMNVQGNYDYSCGFMRRETYWHWSSISGKLNDGRHVGLNLAAGVNETGFTENGFWIDNKFYKVDAVDFKFDRLKPENTWTVQSYDKKVNLRFEPEGKRTEKLNVFLMKSNFTQLFGRYFGELKIENETVTLNGQLGFAENHFAKW